MPKKTIAIELKGEGVEISFGFLFAAGASHQADDLIAAGKHRGPNWSAELEPGDYRFGCGLRAPVGDCGPVVITNKTDGTQLATKAGHANGAPKGSLGTAMIQVPFSVK